MGHPVKCFFCGERFDRDFEPFRKVSANRYAHKHCAMEAKKKSEASGIATINFKNGSSISIEKEKKGADEDMPRVESKKELNDKCYDSNYCTDDYRNAEVYVIYYRKSK